MTTTHPKPRGHSNAYTAETEPYQTNPKKACIPLVGGSRTCRPLPPLALSKEEWREIGRKMGWVTPELLADCQQLVEFLEEVHDDEIRHDHHGDDASACTYCQTIAAAKETIAKATGVSPE